MMAYGSAIYVLYLSGLQAYWPLHLLFSHGYGSAANHAFIYLACWPLHYLLSHGHGSAANAQGYSDWLRYGLWLGPPFFCLSLKWQIFYLTLLNVSILVEFMLISLIYAFFYCCSYIATTGLDNGYFLLLDQSNQKHVLAWSMCFYEQ